jgi:hypothetical protein
VVQIFPRFALISFSFSPNTRGQGQEGVLQYHADQRGVRVLNWSKLGFSGLSRRFKVREIEMEMKESGDHLL